MHNNSRKVNYEHIFNNLEEYMFSSKNMIKYFPTSRPKDVMESKKNNGISVTMMPSRFIQSNVSITIQTNIISLISALTKLFA